MGATSDGRSGSYGQYFRNQASSACGGHIAGSSDKKYVEVQNRPSSGHLREACTHGSNVPMCSVYICVHDPKTGSSMTNVVHECGSG